jgi:hypothetical protein
LIRPFVEGAPPPPTPAEIAKAENDAIIK